MARAANLDFFAAKADQRAVLDFLFSATDMRVLESYSEYDADLQEFRSTDELAAAFPLGTDPHGNGHANLLQLWSPSVMRELTIRQFKLDPAHCNGHTLSASQWTPAAFELAPPRSPPVASAQTESARWPPGSCACSPILIMRSSRNERASTWPSSCAIIRFPGSVGSSGSSRTDTSGSRPSQRPRAMRQRSSGSRRWKTA
jgi:hypothetical protein